MARPSPTYRGPVVVAVDGSDDAARALRFAVRRAQRAGEALRVVHVLPTFPPMAPMAPVLASPETHRIGASILQEALDWVDALAPGLEVSCALHGDDVMANAFEEETEHASALVVGPRRRGPLHWHVGSTTALAVLASHAPVLAVPPRWTEEKPPGPVIVGVGRRSEVERLVQIGIQEAVLLGTSVQVLHAWRPPELYASAIGFRQVAESWEEETTRRLVEATAHVRSDYPDVQVEHHATFLSPKLALTEASHEAGVVLLGRHRTRQRVWVHLGGVVAAALREEGCPVMVVPAVH